MAEQWSSKSHAWVRFLLSLLNKFSPKKHTLLKKFTNFGRFKNIRKNLNSQKHVNFFFKKKIHYLRQHRFTILTERIRLVFHFKQPFTFFSSSILAPKFEPIVTPDATSFFFLSNFFFHLKNAPLLPVLKQSLNVLKFYYVNNFINLLPRKNPTSSIKIFIATSDLTAPFPPLRPYPTSQRPGNLITDPVLTKKKRASWNFFKFKTLPVFAIKITNTNERCAAFEKAHPVASFQILQTTTLPFFLKLLNFSKLIFAVTRDYTYNLNRCKFLLYQITERDFAENTINITRYSKVYETSELLLKFYNPASITRSLRLKSLKLTRLSNKISESNSLIKYDNLSPISQKFFFLYSLTGADCLLTNPYQTPSVHSVSKLISAPSFSALNTNTSSRIAPYPINFSALLSILQYPQYFKILLGEFFFFKSITGFRNSPLSLLFCEILDIFYDKYFLNVKNFDRYTNLLPTRNFFFVIKKKILQILSNQKFPINPFPWYQQSLVRFLEFLTGKRVTLRFYAFLGNNLSLLEKTMCSLWAQKLKNFRKMLGPRLYLSESLEIVYLSLKLKDAFFLTNWIICLMRKISFWKYKLFFRYLKYALRHFLSPLFKELKIKGLKFQLKGKVSVAGNARTRTVFQKIGQVGHSSFQNKVAFELGLVRTFTGVLGLKVWIFF